MQRDCSCHFRDVVALIPHQLFEHRLAHQRVRMRVLTADLAVFSHADVFVDFSLLSLCLIAPPAKQV